MIASWNHRQRVLGLDIGRSAVKAAQVTLGERGATLDGLFCMQRSTRRAGIGPGEAEKLARLLERRGMSAGRAVLIAPSESLVGSTFNVPPADSGASRDQIVQMELSRTQGLSAGGYEFAWWDLPATSGGGRSAQAHAVALPHEAIRPTLDVLTTIGLETVRTVPASLALLASAQRVPVDPREITAVLDLGSQRSHLTLMHAGRVVHERALPDFNLQAIREQLSATTRADPALLDQALGRFGLSDEPDGALACEITAVLAGVIDPLAEEVGMSFAYVSHMYPQAELGPLLLVGGGANIPGLSTRIGGLLELQSRVLSPGQLLGSACFGNEVNEPALTAAVGAALQGGDAR